LPLSGSTSKSPTNCCTPQVVGISRTHSGPCATDSSPVFERRDTPPLPQRRVLAAVDNVHGGQPRFGLRSRSGSRGGTEGNKNAAESDEGSARGGDSVVSEVSIAHACLGATVTPFRGKRPCDSLREIAGRRATIWSRANPSRASTYPSESWRARMARRKGESV
jgi:hypothetical protein